MINQINTNMTSSKDYEVMKEAQSFFKEAIHATMDGDIDKLKSLVQIFRDKHQSYDSNEILEEFQSEGRTLLHIAASSGKLDIIRYILDQSPNPSKIVQQPDKNGMTPLLHATVAESEEAMKLLIQHRADVNAKNKDSATCAHFAASDGSVERLDILVKALADLSICSGAGTPLHWAAGKGRTLAAKYLIEKGVDINIPNGDGLPAILMAAAAHNEDIVCDLLEAGANIDYIVSGNLTLLHLCAENGLAGAVDLIMKLPIGSVLNNMATVDSNYPIHLAAMSANERIVQTLLPHSSSHIHNMTVDEIVADGKHRLAEWHKKHYIASSNIQQPSPISTTLHTKELESTDPPTNPDNIKLAEEHKAKGNEKFRNNEYDAAIVEYSAAIRLTGNLAPLWSNRSACYYAIHNYHNALLDAEVCRRLDPQWSKGCYRLAIARLALGMYEDAAVAAFEGCKLDDSNNELKKVLKEAVRLGQEEHKAKYKS